MTSNNDPLAIVIGAGHIVIDDGDPDCDPLPYLQTKKLRKYMGRQDDLAVIAACRAVENLSLFKHTPRDRIGLFLAVGYIPFEAAELLRLAQAAEQDGEFSMTRLSTTGFHAVNGLLTFQCLPNMPTFHVSTNLDIQGPSFVTYPGQGQLYIALQQACDALHDGNVDIAMLIGVAYQRNFLVRHHFARLQQPATTLLDAAGCLVLARSDSTSIEAIAGLTKLSLSYERFDPFTTEFPLTPAGDAALGPAALPVYLSQQLAQTAPSLRSTWEHRTSTRDGISATSHWTIL